MTESAAAGHGALDLTDAEVRVLGSLIEKEITTPEYYPLSLNALVNACNQSSNRDPVMQLSETDVRNAVNGLRQRGLVRGEQGIGSRVQKFRQRASDSWSLTPAELAVLDVLMLRGPQTVGEIRSRAQRLHDIPSIPEVEAVLEELIGRRPPLAVKLAREPGRKEARFAHTLSGEPAAPAAGAGAVAGPSAPRADPSVTPPHGDRLGPAAGSSAADAGGAQDRIEELERAVEGLRRELEDVRATLDEFRKQFE